VGDVGRAILILSGGFGFGVAQSVDLPLSGWRTCQQSGMAGRAARSILHRRGILSSDTSVLEAGAASALAMVQAVNSGAVHGISPDCGSCSLAVWDGVRDQLALIGRNAAFVSLTRDHAGGRTGTKAGCDRETAYDAPLTEGELLNEYVSLKEWEAKGGFSALYAKLDAGDAGDAALIASRVAKLPALKAKLWSDAKGRAGHAMRQRFKLISALASGGEVEPTARKCGFANARSGIESLRNGDIWGKIGVQKPARLRSRYLH